MLVITFALPEESSELTASLRGVQQIEYDGLDTFRGHLGSVEVCVTHTGMGGNRTRKEFSRFLAAHPQVSHVISAGYAGGLDPALRSGDLLLVENFSDPEWLRAARQALEAGGEKPASGTLETSPVILETCREKEALATLSGAKAVDMETSVLAGLCRDIRFLSLRIISDPADEELAVPFSVCFDMEVEKPKPYSLIAFLARHPSRIVPFARFVREMGRVRRRLTAAVKLVAQVPLPPARS